nr:V-set and immunoglobulin domain-containing protein 8 [Anser cygnoides]
MAGHGAGLLLLLGLMPALLLAVRINSKGREVLYLAKGDSVKLGCPYVLEPEDNGPQGVGIEWIQITPERTGPENVVSDTPHPPRPRRAPAPSGAVLQLPPSHGEVEGRRDGAGGVEEGWSWMDGAGGMGQEGWTRRDGVGKVEKGGGMEQAFRKKQDIQGQAGRAGTSRTFGDKQDRQGRSSTGGTMTRACNVCAHHSYSPHGISYMQCQHGDGDERAAALMCNDGIRHQVTCPALCVHVHVHTCLHVPVSVCTRVCVCPCAPMSLGTRVPVSLGICVPGNPCPCVPVSVFTRVPVSPCPCVPMSMCTHVPVSPRPHAEGAISPAGRAPGDLLIHSLSEVHAGVYQCRVTNRVGYAVCQINLGLSPRGGRQAGIIVGSILGSLLLLSLLGLLIWALICRYRRKECQRTCSDCR